MAMRKKARLVRRTPIGNIYHSIWGDLRMEDPRDHERAERCGQNSLMHDMIFANERYFGSPHAFLFKKLRTLHLIPKEVIEYRIKCLKGKAPSKVPAIVYEYPPRHNGAPGYPACMFSPLWTYPWILPGDTAEVRAKRWSKWGPEDYKKEKPEEIKDRIKNVTKHIESYEKCGRKTHPEYAYITDHRKEHLEFLKCVLRDKLREGRAKRRAKLRKAA